MPVQVRSLAMWIPETLASILAMPGLIWLVSGALIAGVVRGFAGFGTAMIYLPVAGQYLSPFEALTTLVCMDLIGPIPNVPRAWRDGDPSDLLRLGTGLVLGVPLGVFALSLVAPEVFRYGVSTIAMILLVLLIAGVRYRRRLPGPMVVATGGLGGMLAGSVGLPGPPVIMLYMASPHPSQVIRANTMLYLLTADVVMLSVLALFGHLVFSAIGLGLLLAVPYLIGNLSGAAIFRPGREKVYRGVAYTIIALSAITGLPLFD